MLTENVQVELVKGGVAVLTGLIAVLSTYTGIKKTSSSTKKVKEEKLKLVNHPIFQRIEFDKHIVLTTFEFKNKGKEIVFKEIIVQHLNIYKEVLKELCEEIDSNEKMDATELLNRSTKALNLINQRLQKFYIDSPNFTIQEKHVLEIVLNKYTSWGSERDLKAYAMINDVCSSHFHPTIYAKAVTIMDIFLFAITDTIDDANKTLNKLNGDLKGLEFKGVVI